MTYENRERYLLLKQLLVTICLASKQAVLKTSGTTYSLEQQQQLVVKTIREIQDNFTIPYGLLRGGRVHLDLSNVEAHMCGLSSGRLPDGCWEAEYIRKLEDRDELYNCIVHYPLTDSYVEEHAENLKSNNSYDNGREYAGKLVAVTERALNEVRRWAEGKPGNTLEQCVVMVNGCELIEFLFNLTNDIYGVKNADESDIPGC